MQVQLAQNHDRLLGLYQEHASEVYDISHQAIFSLFPAIVQQLELDDVQTEWAKSWLSDTATIFRAFKKHAFKAEPTLESLRNTLEWRLEWLEELNTSPDSQAISILPDHARDPFGRPILIVSLRNVGKDVPSLQDEILEVFEECRLQLSSHAQEPGRDTPVLQFTLIIDLRGSGMANVSFDLVNWFMSELQPRFPGMCAAAFVVNYTWEHSAMWSLVKLLIPAQGLSRIFFLSEVDLLSYFTSEVIPEDLGGTLDYPDESHTTSPHISRPPTPHALISPLTPLPRTSSRNPFFGYSVIHPPRSLSNSHVPYYIPALRGGRRRKRDLVKTLLWMWFERWKRTFNRWSLLLSILALIGGVKKTSGLGGERFALGVGFVAS